MQAVKLKTSQGDDQEPGEEQPLMELLHWHQKQPRPPASVRVPGKHVVLVVEDKLRITEDKMVVIYKCWYVGGKHI